MEMSSLVLTKEEIAAMDIVKIVAPAEEGKRIEDYLEEAGRGFAKTYLGRLLKDNTFKTGDMIETFFESELKLVKNWRAQEHHPGFDGKCDVRVEMKILPDFAYYRNDLWYSFVLAMDDILGVKHDDFEAWVSGTFWAKK